MQMKLRDKYHKMLLRILSYIFPFRNHTPPKHFLGRWGYHWEITKHREYYE